MRRLCLGGFLDYVFPDIHITNLSYCVNNKHDWDHVEY